MFLEIIPDSSIIGDVIRQSPTLAILVIVIWLVLKFLGQQNTFLTSMHKEHLEAREISRTAIRDNTKTMEDNTSAVARLCESISKLVDRTNRP